MTMLARAEPETSKTARTTCVHRTVTKDPCREFCTAVHVSADTPAHNSYSSGLGIRGEYVGGTDAFTGLATLCVAGEPKMYFVGQQTTDGDHLVPRRFAADKLNGVAWTSQHVCKEANERFIGGGVHRRRGDFDFQFVSNYFANFVFRRARLSFHVQVNQVSVRFQIGRQ